MRHLEKRDDRKSRWVKAVRERRGFNKAAVALARIFHEGAVNKAANSDLIWD